MEEKEEKGYYCIVDIRFDLRQAGMDDSEKAVDRYRVAFADALQEIMGAGAYVVLVSASEASYYRDRGYEEVFDAEWQLAHDMVREAGF
jgi:hypothetical protein